MAHLRFDKMLIWGWVHDQYGGHRSGLKRRRPVWWKFKYLRLTFEYRVFEELSSQRIDVRGLHDAPDLLHLDICWAVGVQSRVRESGRQLGL